MPGEYIEKSGKSIAQLSREEFLGIWLELWDKRGRGWEVFEYPVGLEPPLVPLNRILSVPEEPVSDDGWIPSFFSSIFRTSHSTEALAETNLVRFRSALAEYSTRLIDEHAPEYCGYEDELFLEFQLVLPKESATAPKLSEELILSLSYLKHPVSFEVIGSESQIIIQFAASHSDADQLEQQFNAHHSEISMRETSGFLAQSWANSNVCSSVVQFGLSNNIALSLKEFRLTEFDYLVPVIAGMSDLYDDEIAVMQILFTRARGPWTDETLQAIEYLGSLSPFEESRDRQASAKKKLTKPLFATTIRIGAKAATDEEALSIVRRVASGLAAFSNPSSNEFIPLEETGNPEVYDEQALITRTSYRSGMLLSSTELAALVHPPTDKVKSEILMRASGATKPAPQILLGNDLVLGTNLHEGEEIAISLSDAQRSRHIHLIGASGSGKSNLMLNMILQDIAQGKGLCVLDPHGDLIEDVLKRVRETRSDDVILFDPSDAEHPIGFNILGATSELEKTLLSSDLIATFRRFSTSWGDVMDSVLANAILAIVESEKGGTLLDLKRFLVEEDFRHRFLETSSNESVRYFWEHEFRLLGGKPQSSILIRLDAFLRQKLIRNIVCHRETKLDLRRVMDESKCLLIKLSQGAIGEENSYLLGSLLVSKLHQIAISRQDAIQRPFFSIYMDEFHNFITPSMESILSGVRKYNIGLVLSHQEFRQLQSRNQDVASSVLSNCYSRICFRLAETDAERLAKGFSFFDSSSLQNLGIGEAIARVEKFENDFNLSTKLVGSVSEELGRDRSETVRRSSRTAFGSTVEAINDELRRYATVVEAKESDPLVNPPAKRHRSAGSVPPEENVEGATKANEKSIGGSNRPSGRKPSGGNLHRDLQRVIARMAEANGFRAEIEKPILAGKARVDVSVENEKTRIACQVCVSTDVDHEIKNAKKCLAAGFDSVAIVVSERSKVHAGLKGLQEQFSVKAREQVKFFTVTDLLEELRGISNRVNKRGPKKPSKGARLSIEEASEFLNVSVSTVYRWAREGRIPFYRAGRSYQFDPKELGLIGKSCEDSRSPSVDLPPIELPGQSRKMQQKDVKRYRELLKPKKETK
ncbi:MAG: type IV secretion system DNA-binding domain-containing protein [Acidobacteriota bacterium]|nr:MAG: type IV secretion system DNA-binding domain-containing protein [Acidobacteriota bacterium]